MDLFDIAVAKKLAGGGGGGGGGSLTLLATEDLGEVSTTSTSETAIGKTITLSSRDDYTDYDILFVICSSNNQADGGHVATVAGGLLWGDDDYTYKNSASFPLETNNYRRAGDKIQSRATSGTSLAGVYARGETNRGALTFTFYSRLNSARTGTINGTYTAKVYGLNIYDLLNF